MARIGKSVNDNEGTDGKNTERKEDTRHGRELSYMKKSVVLRAGKSVYNSEWYGKKSWKKGRGRQAVKSKVILRSTLLVLENP